MNGLPFDPLDPQRDAVYAAEEAVFPREKDKYLSLAELQSETDRVVSLPWFRRAFPDVRRLTIKDGRGSRWSRWSRSVYRTTKVNGKIHLVKVSRVADVLYHEAVHQVIPAGTEWHGALFCGMLLYFIARLYGEETAKKLRREFKRRDVVWDKRVARFGDLSRNGNEGEA